MKKGLKILIPCLIIVIIIAIVIIVKNKDNSPDGPAIGDSGDVSNKNIASNVVIEDAASRTRTDNRNIDCVYPQIRSFSNKNFENSINSTIAANIRAYIDEMSYIIDEETPATALYSYFATYDRYDCGKYLSLVIDQEYQTGGIRSNKWRDIFNINVQTERLFYLDELFRPGVDFESAIISEITKQAEEKDYELMGGNGISKLPIKQKFYIQDNKLILYFDPSEIAANVFGALYFEMPFTMSEEGYFEI